MPHTNGFKSPESLNYHFGEHSKKFTIRPINAAMYAMMADAFFGPRPVAVAEGSRGNGDLIRYDPATAHFGIMNRDGWILTFFPADPADRHTPMPNADYFMGEIQK